VDYPKNRQQRRQRSIAEDVTITARGSQALPFRTYRVCQGRYSLGRLVRPIHRPGATVKIWGGVTNDGR
jgi:hypothetical protein